MKRTLYPKGHANYHQQQEQYKVYRAIVDRLTEKIAHQVPGIEKRKFREWDLDHIIPVKYGFLNDIPPDKIASLVNLRVIPHLQNTRKGQKLMHPVTLLDCV